ncbi:GAF/PAS/PAC domain-containing protein [Salinarchaeum sp. Harcht-Bsk1]|uniref:bacterio-opsin activator domain-containing protein n=1 Tax=Salinarchaeum sp. Harcht-Bsk1 TaxID=1333523 RepID=UPI00034245AD|nr:bacterio-opsin activator domain-containing protein [Salinarchaeum sp. Harcht-Bsk1]AGN00702.1 GAF/PAS/PAC domain-containing protein [Salinarchaeum sp. Harcht-Bsk1]
MAGDQGSTEPLERLLSGLLGDEGVAVLDDVTTGDVTFEAVTGVAYEGREVIKEVLSESMAAYDEYDLEIEWTVADGDRIVASTRTTAKSRRGILGIPPPEDTRTIETIFDGRLEDGKIAYLRQTFDTRQMMPVAVRRGRGAVLEQMRDGVIVLDDRELVVDANAAAFELLGVEREDAMGESIEDVLGLEDYEIAPSTDPTEYERDGRIYELRSSPIFAEADEPVGHTVVARDVTERERRTRQLAEQRDELERLADLNSILRGVNQALVAATTRQEIDRTVCDRLAAPDLYDAAVVGDVQTWAGDAERWTVAGSRDPTGLRVPELDRPPAARSDGGASVRRAYEPTVESGAAPSSANASATQSSADGAADDSDPADSGVASGDSESSAAPDPADTWTVVPLVYGTTVYGALGLCTDREAVGQRERDVLVELGETIGHAINALETRRLLSADATVALKLDSKDSSDPLVAATANADGDAAMAVDGLVPAGEGQNVAYLAIEGERPASVASSFESEAAGDVRCVRGEGDGADWLLEWSMTGDSPLAALVESGGHLDDASATNGRATYQVEVASDADVRSLVDRLRCRFPEVHLVSKSERSGPPSSPESVVVPERTDLTQRQREALEVAYRSGYFGWPRDSTAEEVADALDVAPSTLHSHLRKAEAAVFDSFFGDLHADD